MPKKVIKHYGTKRHSGRYPWGSGGHSQQRTTSFLGMVEELAKEGLSETEIAEAMGMKTTELRQTKAIEKERQRAADVSQALRLKEKGLSNVAIGERMNKPESTVRSLLSYSERENLTILDSTKETLKAAVAEKGPVDIGVGAETGLNISRTKLLAAVRAAKEEGYQVMYFQEQQLGTGKKTSIMVLAPPDADWKEVNATKSIAQLTDTSEDGGRSYLGLQPIQHVDSKRVMVKYKDEGGSEKDGLIELRRNVDDLDLGNSRYAQVRIGVDGTHYLKGMAVYSDNMPPGVDIVYNVSKPKKSNNKHDVFKPLSDDPDNPFGATIKANGQKGALNILQEQGDWSSWSRNLSSQVLSKQSTKLAKKQLNLAKQLQFDEFDEIMQLTNPTLKKQLLEDFAEGCDAAAVHLKAAALPRQSNFVILPLTNIKPNEIYAPMYETGERVALLRHPHGGIFEIPDVVVNNRTPDGKNIIGNSQDAIGIHPDVAQKLSGADFDGDTVIVVPNRKGDITTAPSLKELKNFDTKTAYPPHDGMKTIDGGTYNASTDTVEYGDKKPSGRRKQTAMGDVSNLITDMTIKGASPSEIAMAVKHSMVVIDSEKHHLNYKQSEIDNNIAMLKEKYQGGPRAGASTVISRASSEYRVPERKEGITVVDPKTGTKRRKYIDEETGEKLYEYTGETYPDAKGREKPRTTVSTKMREFSAFELSSGTPMETLYADHAETLKALANTARLEALRTPPMKRDAKAAKVYAAEVSSIDAKLRLHDLNKPKERQAVLLSNKIYRQKVKDNPSMEPSDKKRLKGQALVEARRRFGASKPKFDLTDREWTAIQMGAISNNKMRGILRIVDPDKLKERALPRTKYKMTDAKIQRAKMMSTAGYTPAEIASALGVSATTIVTTLNG